MLVLSGGQLGLGDESDHWKPTRVSHLADESRILINEDTEAKRWKAVDVSCGLNHTAALIDILEA